MLLRHWREPAPPTDANALNCPSYEDLRIQSEILAYVLGEGHQEETILGLARKFSPASDGTGDVVERAVRDLVGGRLLSIEAGRVVPGRAALFDFRSK